MTDRQTKLSRAEVEQLLERAKSVPAISFGYIRLAEDCLSYMDENEYLRTTLGLGDIKIGTGKEVLARLISQRDAYMEVLEQVRDHLEELLDAWKRGIISEHDGKGGTRSNRNVEMLTMVRAVLPATSEEATDANAR